MSSWRQTRRSRATGARGTGSHDSSPSEGAHPDPPAADLPGLYPVHDGSYGVNSHMNIDPPRSRTKGKKSGSGVVNEEEEDARFSKRMRGRKTKRYGMEADLKKVVDRSREEAGKYTGGDGGSDGYEQEDDEPDPVQPMGQPRAFQPKTRNSDSQPKEEQSESEDQWEPEAPSDRPRAPNDDDESAIGDEFDKLDYQMDVRIPSYGPKFRDDRDIIEKPPYRTIQYSSPDPHALINNRQPSATPLAQTSTFYGMPIGMGSMLASTAYRPISSRSFNAESQLYADANLTTPQSRARSKPAPQPSQNPVIGQQRTHDTNPAGTNNNGTNNPNPNTNNPNINKSNNNANSKPNPGPDSDLIPDPNPNPAPNPEPNANPNPPLPTDTNPRFGFNQKPTYGNRFSTVIPEGMTADEWSEMNDVVGDMIRKQQEETSDEPLPPIASLSHLTREEIEEGKALILDMGQNKRRVLMIEEALNEAAKNPAPSYVTDKSTINLFGNTPRETPVVPENSIHRENGFNTDFEYNTPNQFTQNNGRPDLDDADDEDEEDDDSEFDTLPRPTKKSISNRNPRGRLSQKNLGSGSYWWNTTVLFLVILSTVWGALTLFDSGIPRPQLPSVNVVPSLHIPSLHDVADRVCKIIPCNRPTLPTGWRSENSSAGEKIGDTQSKLVERITPKIPEKVFVETDKNGKPTITQDFWHALRYLIKEDDIILTLETTKKNAPEISDAHWLAIKSRLERNGLGPGAKYAMNDSECTRFWNNWVKQNQKSLEKMIGGITIPRDEFISLLKSEVQSSQNEIRKELAVQDARVKELADALEKLERSNSKINDSRLTRQEVKAISDAAVKRAIENAKLDALATGRIRGHANDMFLNQVNFFGIGSGAVIDTDYTSNPWKPAKDHFKFRSKNWYNRDGYVNLPPTAALSPWFEEGECYCSGQIVKGKAQIMNSIHVMTSRDIVPQHLVVEHILPGSTLDPESMPRDIEVWAYIEEVSLRDEARAFSESNFPATEKEMEPLNEGFVKIGHFVYENKNYGDGIQIFKMSDELSKMGAMTNRIVVRAVSNYGSDHTCFYRLRMYGDVIEVPRWEEWELKA
ncbi:hypothetical protein K449DRAFT_167507 [Hypoxylon sp. EC38]|nr:hypothetical protein K449DRAFT_167507 [Hypoxylon sp. EC38]